MRSGIVSIVLAAALVLLSGSQVDAEGSSQHLRPEQQHTSNYALLVSSSRYWFNYRHVVNALGIYQHLKTEGGYDDDHIVLMLADDLPTNARNPLPNRMYKSARAREDETIFDAETQVDYRGDDVTIETMKQALFGGDNGSNGPTLDGLNADSNLFIYWTGHGGDQFFKFQDVEEITATDINNVLTELHARNKYKSVLFITDTCQAFTLGDKITAPNVYFLGSSLKGENSYAYGSAHPMVGLSVIEKYTQRILEFVIRNKARKGLTLKQALVDHLSFEQQRAHVGWKEVECDRPMDKVLLSDFFSNVERRPGKRPSMQLLSTESVSSSVNSLGLVPPINPTTRLHHREPTSAAQPIENEAPQGQRPPPLQPSDPLFVILAVLFLMSALVVSCVV